MRISIWVKIGGGIVTVALFVLGTTLPSTPWINENRAIYISIVAIIALVIGGIVWFIGTRIGRGESVVSKLGDIVPTLEEMDSLLREEALRESKKPFNKKKYNQVHNRINAEILGITFGKADNLEDIKQQLQNVVVKFTKEHRGLQGGTDKWFKKTDVISGFLDNEGFGLKQYRNRGRYKKLMHSLTKDRDYVTDKELNKLIKEHILKSEILNNMLFDKERGVGIKADYQDAKYGITDLIPAPLVASVSTFERDGMERLNDIRLEIGKRIKVLEMENVKHNTESAESVK